MATTTWSHWLHVAAPFAVYAAAVAALFAAGDAGAERSPAKACFLRISSTLERITGYPGWTMAGVLSGLTLLWVAMIGLYWDVAYHIDFGRDKQLFTPSHTMIVLALAGLAYSAGVAALYATLERAPVGLRLGAVRVPWSAVVLAALGLGGLAGFPLDELWHDAFGIDITLWSPTHLLQVAGGSLAPVALWLMLAEGRPGASPTVLGRVVEVVVFGSVLTGMSGFQGEFDFGVPQFQALYLPVLVAVAAGFALVLARICLGPGGALKAVLAFVVLRSCVALLLGGALGHTVPRFPLYLAGAAAVEVVALVLGTDRRLRFALVSGVLVGTAGLAGELAWVRAQDWFHVSTAVVPKAVVLGTLAAAAAAVVAGGLSAAWERVARLRPALVVAALGVLLACLAVPLPRKVGPVEAVVRLRPAGPMATVEVDLSPPDAAERATAFGLLSWQGGGRVLAGLDELSPGRYVSSRPVPVSGSWKSVVTLQRGDEVMAAPVYLPADPEIGAAAIPAVAERRAPFVRITELLLREAHGGPGWVAVTAYGGLAGTVTVFLALFALGAARVRRPQSVPGGPARRATVEDVLAPAARPPAGSPTTSP